MDYEKDISDIIRDWGYHPDHDSVRRIIGRDGREKIQLRVDLGILQMETEGRPDGRRPHGEPSLLEYHLSKLEAYRKEHGSTKGFTLSREECQELYQESHQYHQRYLSLFSLKDYQGVVRDTNRNLRAHGLAEGYADSEEAKDLFAAEIPGIMMMNAKAKALIHLARKEHDKALMETKRGMQRIDDFFRTRGDIDYSSESEEIAELRELGNEIRSQKPLTESDKLQLELDEAVRKEDFEKAAVIRDRIRDLDIP